MIEAPGRLSWRFTSSERRALPMKRAAARAAGAPLRRPRPALLPPRERALHVALALGLALATLVVLLVGARLRAAANDERWDAVETALLWRRASALTTPQCRRCESLLGDITWRDPPPFAPRGAKPSWDWRERASLPGDDDDDDEDDAVDERDAAGHPIRDRRHVRDDDRLAASLRPRRHPRVACGFHKLTPAEARHVTRGASILFVGNSISRRLMYAVADQLGGKNARVNPLSDGADARYGAQTVWDSKARYHSFFEVAVDANTGQLSDQTTCVQAEEATTREETEIAQTEAHQGSPTRRNIRRMSRSILAANNRTIIDGFSSILSDDRDDARYPIIPDVLGFDAASGTVAATASGAAARRLRCPGGRAAFETMREEAAARGAARLAFAYAGTPPTEGAVALLCAWAGEEILPAGEGEGDGGGSNGGEACSTKTKPPRGGRSKSSLDEQIGSHYDAVVVQVARGSDDAIANLARAATRFSASRRARGVPARVIFLGVPHEAHAGTGPEATREAVEWARTVAWPTLLGGGGDHDGGEEETGGGGGGLDPGAGGVDAFRVAFDVADVTLATHEGVASGRIAHEPNSGYHFTDEGRRLTAQLLLNRFAAGACARGGER